MFGVGSSRKYRSYFICLMAAETVFVETDNFQKIIILMPDV